MGHNKLTEVSGVDKLSLIRVQRDLRLKEVDNPTTSSSRYLNFVDKSILLTKHKSNSDLVYKVCVRIGKNLFFKEIN